MVYYFVFDTFFYQIQDKNLFFLICIHRWAIATSGWSGPGVKLPFICDLAPAATPAPVSCPIGQSYQCECECQDVEVETSRQVLSKGDAAPLLIIPSDNYAAFYGFMMVVLLGLISYPINCILCYYYKFEGKRLEYGPVKTIYSSEDAQEN